jgi:hypothetical protein
MIPRGAAPSGRPSAVPRPAQCPRGPRASVVGSQAARAGAGTGPRPLKLCARARACQSRWPRPHWQVPLEPEGPRCQPERTQRICTGRLNPQSTTRVCWRRCQWQAPGHWQALEA